MVERISLLDELRSGRFESSISTTYSVHFPFYETVVHRRLLGSGCLQQLVLADATQCAAALASADLRPLLAGNSYFLAPISAPGAFHPKVHVLLGKKNGKVLVGSHNLTFSGFGGNAELTNLVAIEPRDRSGVAVARAALDAIRTWCADQPALIEECLKAAEDAAPWLRGPIPTEARELLLWSSPAKTPSLWDQLRAHVRGRCSRVTVIGPFFDRELTFLCRLLEDLGPAELIVGVDPDYSKIPVAQARALKRARFVDARGVLALLRSATGEAGDVDTPPLHAKALWVESEGRQILAIGSANPSRAAWLDANRNAEAILVRIDPDEETVERVALRRLHSAPELTDADWELLDARVQLEAKQDKSSSRIVVAVADGESIVVRGVNESEAVSALVVRTREHDVFEDLPWTRSGDTLTVNASAEVIEAASFVEIGGAVACVAIVHHSPRLRMGGGASSVQGELRTALGAMTADPTQLGNVMQIVEKAIFDEDGVRFRKGELHVAPSRDAQAPERLGDLSVSLEEVKRRRGARKSIAERNLAIVLDLLIHRLGRGLGDDGPNATLPEVEEKDLEVVESELAIEVASDPVDNEALLRACHRKVKKLFARMSQRFEKLDGSPEAAASAVAQLAAVVGVVRWLKSSEPTFSWLPFGESVIPGDARNQFFWDVAGCFATSVGSPVTIARTELGNGPWQEASLALALLGWIGWECDIDLRTLKRHPDEEEQWDYGWASRLMWVLREIVLDEGARTILQETVASVRRRKNDPADWLREHETWAEVVALLESDPKSAPALLRPVQRGDLVRLDMPNGRSSIAYALNVDDKKVFVADAAQDEGKPVLREFVTALDWQSLLAVSAATAAS